MRTMFVFGAGIVVGIIGTMFAARAVLNMPMSGLDDELGLNKDDMPSPGPVVEVEPD